MSIKRGYNTTLTAEQLKFEKENRNMTLATMAKHLGVTIGTLSYNKWVVREQEKPPVDTKYFDADTYFRELVTI